MNTKNSRKKLLEAQSSGSLIKSSGMFQAMVDFIIESNKLDQLETEKYRHECKLKYFMKEE